MGEKNSSLNNYVAELRNNKTAEISALSAKRVKLIDASVQIVQALNKASGEIFNFYGIYTKSVWTKIVPGIVFLLVATAEMPLNATAFEIFNRPQTETLIIAILFGAMVALTAHFSGHFLKRFVVTKSFIDILVGLAIFSVAIIGLATSSKLRVQYLTVMNQSETMLTSQLTQLAMSVFIFFAGVVASFAFTSSIKNTEKEKAYYSLQKEYKKTLKEADKIQGQIELVNQRYNRLIEKGLHDFVFGKMQTKKENLQETKLEEGLEEANARAATLGDLKK